MEKVSSGPLSQLKVKGSNSLALSFALMTTMAASR